MSDIISIFNRLTDSKLADYHLFENVIEDHYDKFRYFYHMVKGINVNKISKITCNIVSKDELLFFVKSNKRDAVKCFNKISDNFNSFNNAYYERYFSCALLNSDCGIEIIIRCTCEEEFDIYADNYSLL